MSARSVRLRREVSTKDDGLWSACTSERYTMGCGHGIQGTSGQVIKIDPRTLLLVWATAAGAAITIPGARSVIVAVGTGADTAARLAKGLPGPSRPPEQPHWPTPIGRATET